VLPQCVCWLARSVEYPALFLELDVEAFRLVESGLQGEGWPRREAREAQIFYRGARLAIHI
jgi:hypothetical protein